MSLEAIKQVTQAEADARQRQADAAVQAKKLVADAERAGKEVLVKARAEGAAKAKELMLQAEQRSAERTAQAAAQAEEECRALRSAAQGRLEEAAALIVRRVVSS